MKMMLIVCLCLLGTTAARATQCEDGHESSSTGSGTCSHHGGEAK